MAECTFKPKINKNTTKYINPNSYVPVHERPVLSNSMIEERYNDDSYEDVNYTQEIKVSKPLDPNFYEKQILWKKQKSEKLQKRKLEEEMRSTREVSFKVVDVLFLWFFSFNLKV